MDTDKSYRLAVVSLAATVFFALLPMAFPSIPRLIIIVGVALSLMLALRYGWPWLRELPGHVSLDAIEAYGSAARLRIDSWRVKQWIAANIADDEFADEELVNECRAAQATERELWNKMYALGRQIDDLLKKMPKNLTSMVIEEPPLVTNLREQKDAVVSDHETAQTRVKWAIERARDDVHWKLKSGELLARGFLMPHIPGRRPRIIPTPEWQFLKLYRDEDPAKAMGAGIEYVAVEIGRPKKRG